MTVRYPTVSGKKALDPGPIYDYCVENGLDTSWWGLPNSIHCPVGVYPGSAWFLMSRTDGDALSLTSPMTIAWKDGDNTTNFQNYYLHQAKVIGLDGDGNAPYLVELRDQRHKAAKLSTKKTYNVRQSWLASITGTAKYFSGTLNSGSAWTWQTIFEDLYPYDGSPPSLPYTATMPPENFFGYGRTAQFIDTLLSVLQTVICLDPTQGTISAQVLGDAQEGLEDSQSSLASSLILREESRSVLSKTSMPANIQFLFPKRQQVGLAYNVRGLNLPYISKDYSVSGNGYGSISYIVPFLADIKSDATTENDSDLNTMKTELGDKIKARLQLITKRTREIYSGIQTDVMPGSEIHEVIWRDNGSSEGLVTEWVRDPSLAYPPPVNWPYPSQIDQPRAFVAAKEHNSDSWANDGFWPLVHVADDRITYSQEITTNDGGGVGSELTAQCEGLYHFILSVNTATTGNVTVTAYRDTTALPYSWTSRPGPLIVLCGFVYLKVGEALKFKNTTGSSIANIGTCTMTMVDPYPQAAIF